MGLVRVYEPSVDGQLVLVLYIHLDATASHHDQAIVSPETGQARTLSEKESVGQVISILIGLADARVQVFHAPSSV